MEEEKYLVYLHKNITNGKIYVGITSHVDPNNRWRGGRGYQRNVLFTRAIKKYGWDNFNHRIIFKNISKQLACKIETLLIQRYKNRNICYNIANGGQGTASMNEFIKRKISISCSGKRIGNSNPMRHLSVEQKKFHSEKMKRTWANNNMIDKLRQGIERGKNLGRYRGNHNKMPESTRNAINKAIIKPVLCFNLQGELIKEYKSISGANMEFGVSKKSSNISRACKKERKTAYGFIWKFKEEREVINGI